MRRTPATMATGLLALAALALSACGLGKGKEVRVLVIGESDAARALGPYLPLAAQLVRGATSEGLVTLDEEGRVVPALADRWIVTDDGSSYIFRLRSGAWHGGENSGPAVRAALVRTIADHRDTPLGIQLAVIDEVRAMAGRVIEIRLKRPEADFLQLLAQPELGLRRPRDPSPMEMRQDGKTLVLTPLPPQRRGQPEIDDWASRARALRIEAAPATRALAAFANHDADILLGGTFADLPRLGQIKLSQIQLGRSRPRFDPVTGLFGLQVSNTRGLLATPAAREALAMAIDRNALAAALAIPDWTPTTRVIPASVDGMAPRADGGERWLALPMAVRQQEAARRIAAVAGNGPGNRRLTLALPDGPGADLLFGRLKADFAAVGVDLQRAGDGAAADLRLIDLVARTPGPAWAFAQLSCAARRGVCAPDADRLVLQAAAADPRTAADLLTRAETLLTQANSFIPLGAPVRWSLVPAATPGFAPNRWGMHPLFWLATGGS